ncbi:MAG: SRPBCC family protein, partial [Candidatus Bathyarchaeia archaeon]
VGATYHVVGAMEPKGVFDVEITEYVENEKAIWRSTAGNFTAFGTTTLTPTDSGTLLTFVIDYELPFSILGKIVDKIRVSKDIERSIEKGLKKMKETLEKS